LLPRRQLARSEMEDTKYVLPAVSGHVWVSTGTVQNLFRDFCCEYAAWRARVQGGSSSLHQKLVDIRYQIWFRGDFAWAEAVKTMVRREFGTAVC
jgi:hypothetical protein